MKQLIFTLFTLITALWFEVSLAHFGFILPFVFFQIFYITVVRRWQWGIVMSFLVCATLDSLLGYVSLPGGLLIVLMASIWRKRGDCSRLELQVVAVFFVLLIGLGNLFLWTIIAYHGKFEWFYWSWQFIFGVGVMAVISPFIINLQDFIAEKMGISTYLNIQKEELYSVAN